MTGIDEHEEMRKELARLQKKLDHIDEQLALLFPLTWVKFRTRCGWVAFPKKVEK